VSHERAPLLAWRRRRGAASAEFRALSRIVGRVYMIARYDAQPRRAGQWRLTATDEPETLDWCTTLGGAKHVAEAYEAQRIEAAAARGQSPRRYPTRNP
jgi:hypothetical protein